MELHLTYKNELKTLSEQNSLVSELCAQINRRFYNLEPLELNVELIKLMCNKIEKTVSEKRLSKFDKLECFFLIYERLFSKEILERNKRYLTSVVEYLHDNNDILSQALFSITKRLLKHVFLGLK